MKKDRGFTLVELIVVIAILGFVGLMIAGFMKISSETFQSADKEINLQYEAQLTVNQLKDLIIDVNRGLFYEPVPPTGGPAAVSVSLAEEGAAEKKSDLYIYNTDKTAGGGGAAPKYDVTRITWDKTNHQLYYAKMEDGGSFGAVLLLSDYVTDFSIDLSQVDDRKVGFDITFTNGDRTYRTTPVITLRNRVKLADSLDSIYVDPGVEVKGFVLSIVIQKGGVTIDVDDIYKATTQAYTALVTVQFGADDTALWKLEGSTVDPGKDESSVTDGRVTVSADEKAAQLKLIAISMADPTKTAELILNVREGVEDKGYVTSVTLRGQKGSENLPVEKEISNKPEEGTVKEYSYREEVTYLHEEKLKPEQKGVTWECSTDAPRDSYSFDSVNGVVRANYRANGYQFTIIARAKAPNLTGGLEQDKKTYIIRGLAVPTVEEPGPEITINGIDSELKRGWFVELQADVKGLKDAKNVTYEWEIVDYSENFKDGMKIETPYSKQNVGFGREGFPDYSIVGKVTNWDQLLTNWGGGIHNNWPVMGEGDDTNQSAYLWMGYEAAWSEQFSIKIRVTASTDTESVNKEFWLELQPVSVEISTDPDTPVDRYLSRKLIIETHHLYTKIWEKRIQPYVEMDTITGRIAEETPVQINKSALWTDTGYGTYENTIEVKMLSDDFWKKGYLGRNYNYLELPISIISINNKDNNFSTSYELHLIYEGGYFWD